jgi:hypothetical protein
VIDASVLSALMTIVFVVSITCITRWCRGLCMFDASIVSIASFSVYDAFVHMTHFAAVCIVVHHTLVPPVVHVDSICACSQFQ